MASTQILDAILLRLERHSQRATYGAIGPMLGYLVSPGQKVGNLLAKRPRNPRHSWIVTKKDGLPSGYDKTQWHPNLFKNTEIIDDPDEFKEWFSTHP